MQIYLVGGAVRDQLLARPVTEKDWVVVGATAEQMLTLGYRQVGKDFPVFLHPQTQEEYALARLERKSGSGYHGFEVFTATTVTLEQDLQRRDLTINAIAMADDGELIDPYGGQADIRDRLLRHVSPAFQEDPLRVLRVARFAARYHHLGFTVAPETLDLMGKICRSGELKSLSAERIWKETQRALSEKSPSIYFETLRACGGLKDWFPELDALWGIPNPPQWHPEVDTGLHTMMVLEQAALLTDDTLVRFAAICHDLGKGITPTESHPSHPGHEKLGVPLVDKLCKRLKAPIDYQKLAKIGCEYHLHLHRIEVLRAATIVKVLEKTDAFRQPHRFEQFLQVCEADYRGRTGFEDRPYPQANLMREALDACRQIDVNNLMAQGYQGKQLGEEIHRQRVSQVKHLHD